MKENNTAFEKIIFGFELALLLVIPFVVWWSITPTNVLNSNSLYKLLETIGIGGSGIILLVDIPAGIIGIIKAKRMIKLRKTTFTLSIINLVAGSFEVFMLLLIFCAVVFGGVSVLQIPIFLIVYRSTFWVLRLLL